MNKLLRLFDFVTVFYSNFLSVVKVGRKIVTQDCTQGQNDDPRAPVIILLGLEKIPVVSTDATIVQTLVSVFSNYTIQ